MQSPRDYYKPLDMPNKERFTLSGFCLPGAKILQSPVVSATAANFQLPIDLCISIALQNRGYYSSARATIGPHVI